MCAIWCDCSHRTKNTTFAVVSGTSLSKEIWSPKLFVTSCALDLFSTLLRRLRWCGLRGRNRCLVDACVQLTPARIFASTYAVGETHRKKQQHVYKLGLQEKRRATAPLCRQASMSGDQLRQGFIVYTRSCNSKKINHHCVSILFCEAGGGNPDQNMVCRVAPAHRP